jgi:hypothetical protein
MRVNADTIPFLLYNALKDYINRSVTDLILAVVELLERDINRLVVEV